MKSDGHQKDADQSDKNKYYIKFTHVFSKNKVAHDAGDQRDQIESSTDKNELKILGEGELYCDCSRSLERPEHQSAHGGFWDNVPNHNF